LPLNEANKTKEHNTIIIMAENNGADNSISANKNQQKSTKREK
jgi:hypothetical protein